MLVTARRAFTETGPLRALKVLSAANQTTGFDCPGCAWPDPKGRSALEFCENGAKAILDEATKARADLDEYDRHALTCLQDRELNDLGRLTRPFLFERGSPRARAISYEEAYDRVAQELSRLESPHRAAFYTSGRTSNEAAFAYQLFVRAFGTNNLPDCSNLCHESSGLALKQTLGIGKGTVLLEDFALADLILVVGQNPGTNHPRMLSALRSAKQGGCTIVSVNPLVEAGLRNFSHPQHFEDLLSSGVDLADWFLRVQVGGDQALFRFLNKVLLQWEQSRGDVLDHDFLTQHTIGLEGLRKACELSDSVELERQSGVTRAEVERLAELVCNKKKIIVCWAMGLTQHENAVDTICEVVDFMLLRGNVGRPGAGLCPVRGHSNVQGDRTVGIVPELPLEVLRRIEKRYGFEVPREPGLDSVGTLQALRTGAIDVFVSLGGNFLGACPDTAATELGLSRCRLAVHITTKINRSHLVNAKSVLLLPCLGRSERDVQDSATQFVTVENSMGIVHASSGNLEPCGPAVRSEPRIVCELAESVLQRSNKRTPALRFRSWADDYDRLRDEIQACIPGFDDYNQRVRAPGGFELPNGPRRRVFPTPSGKAVFVVGPVRRLTPGPSELLLMTVRSHDQFNTTIYSDEDRYRGISRNRRVLMMHPSDLAERNLTSGDRIVITSYHGPKDDQKTRRLCDFFAISYNIPAGSAAAYFPEANPLLFADSFADQSRTPTSKSTRIRVEKQ